jgi:hypothetical protein
MANISFGAPVHVIRDWLRRHELVPFLSASEKAILNKEASEVTDQELTSLWWYIEALWALLWATRLVEKMPFTEPVPDTMASHCPNLQLNEGPARFTEHMELRSYDEIYKERDLYYRVMWCCRHFQLTGRTHPNFNMDVVMERRKALEWIMNSELEWDDVPMDT